MTRTRADLVDPWEPRIAARIRAWADQAVEPIDALEVARAAAATSWSRARGIQGHRVHGSDSRARGRPLLAFLIVLAAALGLVTGAFLLSAGQTSTPAPPTPTMPRLLPDQLPLLDPNGALLPKGVIETPIGRARWVHLSGSSTTLPGPLTPLPGPSGVLWFDGGDHGPVRCEATGELECLARPQLWMSADGVSERTELPLPVEAESVRLTRLGDTWWLTSFEPVSLWRSTDVLTWEQVDLTTLVSPGPVELTWAFDLTTPVSSRDITIVPVDFHALDAGRLLGRPDLGEWVWPQPATPGRYRVMRETQGGPEYVGDVVIEAVAEGLRFADIDGTTIALLDGVGPDFLDAWTANHRIAVTGLAIVDSGCATVASALAPTPYVDADALAVLGTPDGFRAYLPIADMSIQTWHSSDARVWVPGELLGDSPGEPRATWFEALSHGEHDPVLRAWVFDEVRQKDEVWESSDGSTWVRIPEAPGASGVPRPIAGGWLAVSLDEQAWWASVDGEDWQRVRELEGVTTLWTTLGAGSHGPTGFVGDGFTYAVDEEELDRRDLWIIEFERSSPAPATKLGSSVDPAGTAGEAAMAP